MDSNSFNKAPTSSYVSADNPWYSVESVPFNNGGGAPMSEGSEQSKMQKEISQLILNDDGTRKAEYIDKSANGEREKNVEKDIDERNEELNKKVERGEISKEEAYRRQDEMLEDAIKRIDEIRMEEYERQRKEQAEKLTNILGGVVRQRQEQAEAPLLEESKDQKSPQELMDEIDANRNRELQNKKAFQVAVTPGIAAKGNSVAKDEFERVIGEKVTKETATGRIIGEKHYAELADTDYDDDYQVETWVVKDIANLEPEPTTEDVKEPFARSENEVDGGSGRIISDEEVHDGSDREQEKESGGDSHEYEKALAQNNKIKENLARRDYEEASAQKEKIEQELKKREQEFLARRDYEEASAQKEKIEQELKKRERFRGLGKKFFSVFRRLKTSDTATGPELSNAA